MNAVRELNYDYKEYMPRIWVFQKNLEEDELTTILGFYYDIVGQKLKPYTDKLVKRFPEILGIKTKRKKKQIKKQKIKKKTKHKSKKLHFKKKSKKKKSKKVKNKNT